MQNAGRHVSQFRSVDLEKLVPGQGLQNMGQRLAVVPVRRKTGFINDLAHFAPDHRDRLYLLGVDGRGEQTDEQALA